MTGTLGDRRRQNLLTQGNGAAKAGELAQANFWFRESELVKRGMKAVNMIFQLSSRVPMLIERSQLERKEGLWRVSRNH